MWLKPQRNLHGRTHLSCCPQQTLLPNESSRLQSECCSGTVDGLQLPLNCVGDVFHCLMCIADSLYKQLHSVRLCGAAHANFFLGDCGMPLLATVQQSKLGIQQEYECRTRAMPAGQLCRFQWCEPADRASSARQGVTLGWEAVSKSHKERLAANRLHDSLQPADRHL